MAITLEVSLVYVVGAVEEFGNWFRSILGDAIYVILDVLSSETGLPNVIYLNLTVHNAHTKDNFKNKGNLKITL